MTEKPKKESMDIKREMQMYYWGAEFHLHK
jgi:hypothetical protein